MVDRHDFAIVSQIRHTDPAKHLPWFHVQMPNRVRPLAQRSTTILAMQNRCRYVTTSHYVFCGSYKPPKHTKLSACIY